MMNKKMLFGIFASMMVLLFAACENGTSDLSDVIATSKPSLENSLGTGTHSFTVGVTTVSDSLPENFQFQELIGNYAGATDTTGDGGKVTFTLAIEVPAELTGQSVTVTIDPYKKNEGDEHFAFMYFNGNNNLREFTFTPDVQTVELTAKYSESDIVQRGELPLAFSYDAEVYKNTMPSTLDFSVFSNGTTGKNRVVLHKLTELTDDLAVAVDKPDNYVLTIKDKNLESTKNENYNIPLVMNLTGVLEEYPITVIAKDSENVTVSNIAISGGIVTFDVKHSGIDKFQTSNGKEVTLTVDVANLEHSDEYEGLPFDIVINTQRDHTFKYYIDEYANNFTVSNFEPTNLLKHKNDTGYYTEVGIPGIAGATAEGMITYEILRKDDSSADFKLIHTTEPVPANAPFTYKDYNAFILTTPEQEYKIKFTHVGCTSSSPCSREVEKLGSRMLTQREILLAAIETIRTTFDWFDAATDTYYLVHTNTFGRLIKCHREGSITGNYYHGLDRSGMFDTNCRRYMRFVNYKNSLVTLDGTFMKDDGDAVVGQALHGVWVHKGFMDKSGWPTDASLTPRKEKLTVTFGGATIDIVLNNIDINNNDANTPDWISGSFDVTQNGVMKSYDNVSGVPFGFFMDAATFRNAIGVDDYTQK